MCGIYDMGAQGVTLYKAMNEEVILTPAQRALNENIRKCFIRLVIVSIMSVVAALVIKGVIITSTVTLVSNLLIMNAYKDLDIAVREKRDYVFQENCKVIKSGFQSGVMAAFRALKVTATVALIGGALYYSSEYLS